MRFILLRILRRLTVPAERLAAAIAQAILLNADIKTARATALVISRTLAAFHHQVPINGGRAKMDSAKFQSLNRHRYASWPQASSAAHQWSCSCLNALSLFFSSAKITRPCCVWHIRRSRNPAGLWLESG